MSETFTTKDEARKWAKKYSWDSARIVRADAPKYWVVKRPAGLGGSAYPYGRYWAETEWKDTLAEATPFLTYEAAKKCADGCGSKVHNVYAKVKP